MPFLSSQGRPIYYERHGSGPAVLFLHGAGSNAATWWQQIPAFVSSYSCLTMDIRCFGRSVAPLNEFEFSFFVADVVALLEHECVERVVLIGQSLGGMIAFRVAMMKPELIAGFVACDTTLAIDHPVLVESVDRRFRNVSAVSIEQRSLGAWFLKTCPALAGLYAQLNHFNPSAHSISTDAWRGAMLTLNEPSNLAATTALKSLHCPTLFLVGADDPIVPSQVMYELSELVSESEVMVIKEAAHSAYFEKPDEFNAQVLDFLARRVYAIESHESRIISLANGSQH